jgi:hypothetical protein
MLTFIADFLPQPLYTSALLVVLWPLVPAREWRPATLPRSLLEVQVPRWPPCRVRQVRMQSA